MRQTSSVPGSRALSRDYLMRQFKGSARARCLLHTKLTGADVVIHLAYISDNPSFELDIARQSIISAVLRVRMAYDESVT